MDRPSTSAGRPRGGPESLANVANRLRTPMYISDRAMPPETQTITAVEKLLHIPGTTSTSEEAFVEANTGEDGLVTDPDFPPGPPSLYPDPDQPPASAIEAVAWRRVSGALYLPMGTTPRLLQGAMNNHSFLGALGAVACNQELLLDLIVSDEHAGQGAYTFQFYKHGCWQQVVVDNFLPCNEGEDRLTFACSGHVGELWPSLIEKAYAKVHGSYYALEGGALHEVLADLTGGVSTKVKLDQPQGRQAAVDGSLWSHIMACLANGGVLAAKAKNPAVGDEPGPGGIMYNTVYSIIDARLLEDNSTQLVRLHCAWPVPRPIWLGSWAPGTTEWSSTVCARKFAAELAHLPEDDGTCWMSFGDFANIFNRLYICRMFPPSWHQLTLHCGWQGPSAGGPYHTTIAAPSMLETGGQSVSFSQEAVDLPPPSPSSTTRSPVRSSTPPRHQEPKPFMSSTWCCNPQFRITVRKSCEVVVALGQQDPRVEHRQHYKKQQRRRSIGMMVLRVPVNSLGRRWEARPGEVVQEVELSAAREVSTTFRAEPDYAYTVVSYTGRPGDEAAFVLRTFSSSALEVEQLPSPLCLVLGGQWLGFLAGGSKGHSSFGSNPQYMISTQHKTQVVISVVRLDMKYSVMKPAFEHKGCVGVLLCYPDKATDGVISRKEAIRSPAEVHAEAEHRNMEEAVLLANLEPDIPYVLAPSLHGPKVEAPFELRIMSSVPVELVPLPEVKTVVLHGEWGEDNSGGCDLHPTWKKNPRYLLGLSKPARVRVSLTKTMKPKAKVNVDDMIGFYILQASSSAGEIKGDLRKAVLAETTFVTTPANSAEFDLQGGVPYVIIPSTYAPNRHARYCLGMSAPVDFDLVEL